MILRQIKPVLWGWPQHQGVAFYYWDKLYSSDWQSEYFAGEGYESWKAGISRKYWPIRTLWVDFSTCRVARLLYSECLVSYTQMMWYRWVTVALMAHTTCFFLGSPCGSASAWLPWLGNCSASLTEAEFGRKCKISRSCWGQSNISGITHGFVLVKYCNPVYPRGNKFLFLWISNFSLFFQGRVQDDPCFTEMSWAHSDEWW